MNIDYVSIFEFALSQSDFSTRINLDKKKLSVNQILTFELVDDNFDFVKELIANIPSNMAVYVGSIDAAHDSFKLDDSCLYEEIEIRIEHNLVKIDYPLLINNEKDFFEFLKKCILPLEIVDIETINNTIRIVISEEIEKKIQLKAHLPVLYNDNRYTDKKAIVVPGTLPDEYLESFSKNILISFFDVISERKLNEHEYLIRVGNISSLIIPEEIFFSKKEIEAIYFIVEFIFDDINRYEDKLQILRKVLTNYFSKNSNLENISWNNISQVVKDNYSLFIDNKIDAFIEMEQQLYRQQKAISEEITKDINNKIEEISKQILTILATLISSFILKIDDEQRLWILGLAILYSGVLLVMNKIKGFYFSFHNIESRKNKVRESLSRVVGPKKLEEFDMENNDVLKKLHLIERVQKYFLILIVMVLIVSFIIA